MESQCGRTWHTIFVGIANYAKIRLARVQPWAQAMSDMANTLDPTCFFVRPIVNGGV